jgi:hypothetical protein
MAIEAAVDQLVEDAHRAATGMEPARLASELQELLGQKLVAFAVGDRHPRTIGRYARGERLPEPRAKVGRRRPHLITSVRVREDVEGRLRGEYMTAALLLTLVVSAIDTVTVAHGHVGVIEDSAIALTPGELDMFGFTPGVGEPNGGWADR